MGMEIQIDSLEDMCELMCNNRIPKRRERMKCPNCEKDDNCVTNTRHLGDYIIVRYRKCNLCGERFVTREIIKHERQNQNTN